MMIRRILSRSTGQGLVEYSLILLLIVIVVIAALLLIGPRISNMFGSVYDSLV